MANWYRSRKQQSVPPCPGAIRAIMDVTGHVWAMETPAHQNLINEAGIPLKKIEAVGEICSNRDTGNVRFKGDVHITQLYEGGTMEIGQEEYIEREVSNYTIL